MHFTDRMLVRPRKLALVLTDNREITGYNQARILPYRFARNPGLHRA